MLRAINTYPAVIIATLISEFGAGVFCVVLSAAAVWFFLLPPHLSFYVEHPGQMLANLSFVPVTLRT
jgi:K+-sensing histidine kinase KdpD